MSQHKDYIRQEAKAYSEVSECTCLIVRNKESYYSLISIEARRMHDYLKVHCLGYKVCEVWENGVRLPQRGWIVE